MVVTRPKQHAQELMDELQASGLEVRHQPLIEITPLEDDDSTQAIRIRQVILNLDNYHAVIAISQNAAESGITWLQNYWPQMPVGIQWFAVGPTTAEVLRQEDLSVQQPETDFSSEGLLALESLHADQVKDKKILILRGVGGRETLAKVLRDRGATVEYAELYMRHPKTLSASDWNQVLDNRPLVLFSSGQALSIAEEQVPELAMRVRAILVPSSRVAEQAKKQGYPEVLLAASARNEDTLACLQHWLNKDRIEQ